MGIKDLKKKLRYKRAKWKYRNRSITRAKVLYQYFIFSAIGMFLYAISCIFTGYSFWYVISPLVLLVSYFIMVFLKKNWKIIWLYIRDVEQGKLLLYLNRFHYSEDHKMKVIKWVYLRRKTIRNERWLELSNKVGEGKELTKREKKEMKFKVAYCPQQVLDGFNKAILIDALIYAHTFIHILDDELRDIMDLTDENMMKFNLQNEIDRCKTKDERDKIKNYKEKAMRIIKNRKK
jgi:hypothetical protein